jgi:hypothetical protein
MPTERLSGGVARLAYELWIVCLLLQGCTYVRGPCTHTETVIVETSCESGGKAGTARPLPGR